MKKEANDISNDIAWDIIMNKPDMKRKDTISLE